MPEIKVAMTITVEDQFILDILTTMVESGGSSYWANILEVTRNDNGDITSFMLIEDEEAQEAKDMGKSSDEIIASMAETVTAQSIVDTLSKIMSDPSLQHGYVWDYIRQGVTEQDAGEFDAEATDFLLQIAVLDKVVYA